MQKERETERKYWLLRQGADPRAASNINKEITVLSQEQQQQRLKRNRQRRRRDAWIGKNRINRHAHARKRIDGLSLRNRLSFSSSNGNIKHKKKRMMNIIPQDVKPLMKEKEQTRNTADINNSYVQQMKRKREKFHVERRRRMYEYRRTVVREEREREREKKQHHQQQ